MPVPEGEITTSEILVQEVVQEVVQVLEDEELPEELEQDDLL